MHLKTQHPSNWSEYQKVDHGPGDAIPNFFHMHVPFTNMLNSHFNIEEHHSFAITTEIVNKIIGDMLLDPEDEDEQISKGDRAVFLGFLYMVR